MYKWSQTADNNATADSTVNAQENQAPSTYNNAMRALMAAVAKYRDDQSGNLVLGGTSTAYTVTTNQGFTALTDGIHFCARMNLTNGVDPTLVVDALTAKAIRKVAATAIGSGALVAGSIQKFTYDSGDDSWIVSSVPGGVMLSADNPDLVAIEALVGTSGALKKTAANTWALDDLTTALIFIKDTGNADVQLDTGILGDIQVDFACTITGVTLLADQTGSAVVDIWKDTYANYPPTDADSIAAAALPTISSTTKYNDTTLTGWTTSISAGDTLRFNLDSVTDISRLMIKLKVKRYA